MHINTDHSPESAAARQQSHYAEAGTNASQPSSNPAGGSDASQIDPSLQRLADFPAGVQEADWEIQDGQTAGQAVEAARQWMSEEPGKVLAAHGNPMHQVFQGLLQATD